MKRFLAPAPVTPCRMFEELIRSGGTLVLNNNVILIYVFYVKSPTGIECTTTVYRSKFFRNFNGTGAGSLQVKRSTTPVQNE